MRYLTDPVLRLRVLGLSIAFGMLTVAAGQWRDSFTSKGTYLREDLESADNAFNLCLTLTVVTLAYVAVNLILTPRPPGDAV